MIKLWVFVFRGDGNCFWPGSEVQSKSWGKGGAGTNAHLLKYFCDGTGGKGRLGSTWEVL